MVGIMESKRTRGFNRVSNILSSACIKKKDERKNENIDKKIYYIG